MLLPEFDLFDLRQPLLAFPAFLVPILASEAWLAALVLLLFHYLLSAAPASASLLRNRVTNINFPCLFHATGLDIIQLFSLGHVCLAWFIVHSSLRGLRRTLLILHTIFYGNIREQLDTLAYSDCVIFQILNRSVLYYLLNIFSSRVFLFHDKVGVLSVVHYNSQIIRDFFWTHAIVWGFASGLMIWFSCQVLHHFRVHRLISTHKLEVGLCSWWFFSYRGISFIRGAATYINTLDQRVWLLSFEE